MNILYFINILIFYIVLPNMFMKLVYEKQKKWSNQKLVIITDILCFLFFTFLGFALFYIISAVVAAISSDSTIHYMSIVYLRIFIGFLCGVLYSFLINFRQMGKYLEKINVVEQKENLFVCVVILEIIFIFCFVKLCHIWHW